jgi:hypothetical protein
MLVLIHGEETEDRKTRKEKEKKPVMFLFFLFNLHNLWSRSRENMKEITKKEEMMT